jgi:hypothetical protein
MPPRTAVLIHWLIILWVYPYPLFAQQVQRYDEPELTLRPMPERALVQQQIIQHIQLISLHPFNSLNLDLPAVPGADLIPLLKPRVRHFLSYGVEGYAYETTRAIIPLSSGPLSIPTVGIVGSIIRRDQEVLFQRQGEALIIDVAPIPEGINPSEWLVATEVTSSTAWSKPPTEVRVGDTLRRTVELVVTGVNGERIPLLKLDTAAGVGVLPGPVQRSTRTTPTGLSGTLQQSFDSYISTEQPVVLPAITVNWWHSTRSVWQRLVLPAQRIEPLPRHPDRIVAEQMALAEIAQDQVQQYLFKTRFISILLIMAIALLAIGFFAHTRFGARFRIHSAKDRQLLQRLRKAATPEIAYNALLSWSQFSWQNDALTRLTETLQRLDADQQETYRKLKQEAYCPRSTLRSKAEQKRDRKAWQSLGHQLLHERIRQFGGIYPAISPPPA